MSRLLDALPAGSYLALNEGVDTSEELNAAQQVYNDSGAIPYVLRSPAQIAGFFDGLELVEPGVVSVPLWRPDPADQVSVHGFTEVTAYLMLDYGTSDFLPRRESDRDRTGTSTR